MVESLADIGIDSEWPVVVHRIQPVCMRRAIRALELLKHVEIPEHGTINARSPAKGFFGGRSPALPFDYFLRRRRRIAPKPKASAVIEAGSGTGVITDWLQGLPILLTAAL